MRPAPHGRCRAAGARADRAPRVDQGPPSVSDPGFQTGPGGRAWSQLDRLAERRKALVAYPVDLAQLVDRAEPAVRIAVLDDPPGKRRTDPVERVELRNRRGRQADRLRRLRRIAAR